MKKLKREDSLSIVLTGGHAGSTAAAVLPELKKNFPGREIVWIGAKKALHGTKTRTYEQKVFPEAGVRIVGIEGRGFRRGTLIGNFLSLIHLGIGFFQALFALARMRPKAVLSFGGFTAVPVVIAAYTLRIPVVIHEQTVSAGLANRLSAPFAKRIALSRRSSQVHFPRKRSRIVGNPVRVEILRIGQKKKLNKKPVLFITGGSRGSQKINKAVVAVAERLLASYELHHQTGELDYRQISQIAGKHADYHVYSFLSPWQLVRIYKKADIIVARAGANTVSEIIALRRPSVLIPIPWTTFNEQGKNAEFASKSGIAEVLEESRLANPDSLLEIINKVRDNWYQMVKEAGKHKGMDRNAAKKLAHLVEEMIHD